MIRSFGFPASITTLHLFTQDASLKAHPAYRQAKAGGRDVLVMVNAGRNPALVPEKRFVRLIKERFDDEITKIFGVEPAALTANEAGYLVGFQSIEQLRNRRAAAEQEIDRRLRSKGIARAPQEASSGASADQSLNGAGQEAGDS
jgi:hypothetical protein